MAYQNYAGAWLPETVQGAQVTGSASNTTYYGPNQNNTWGVTGNYVTLVGGVRDDYYWLTNPSQTPVEQAGGGTDTARIWQSYVLPQNVENLILFGDGQFAIGNSGDNIIQGLGRDEKLYGGLGSDVLIGSGGSGTTFVIAHGEGDKVIQNFNVATDTVRLIGAGLTTFDQVKAAMVQQGSDVVLNDGGTHVLFRNSSIGAFQARDFALPLDYAKLGTMTFNEDFNSASTIGTTWQPYFRSANQLDSYTLPRNGEQQIYTNASFTGTGAGSLGLNPFSFDNGVMTIQAKPVSDAQSSQMWGYHYSSGMLQTTSFNQTYGYFEVRAELPKGQGLWPAFWLLGQDNRELDVLEALGTDTRTPDFAYHTPATNPGASYHGFNPYADGFHNYGMMWDREHLTFYVDSVPVWQTDTPVDADKPMYMILNLAVGGNWPGSPDGSTPWPAEYKIDYVRVYNLPGDGVNTGGATPPPPVTTTPPVTTPPPVTTTPADTGSGQVLTATSINAVLAGGAGADTLNASQAGDTLTGGAGADVFALSKEPWSPIHITDFQVGTDKIDLTALFKTYGYAGTDPVADGWIVLANDGAGGTIVRFDHDGRGSNPLWPNTIVDLDHVSSSGLTWSQLSAGAASGGSTTTPTPSPVTQPTSGAGQVLTAASTGAVLTGGAGADTLNASQANDTLTGGAGADVFALSKEPWSPIHITDFQIGTDKLDLSALFRTYGYAGSDPVADGWIVLASDGAGGTIVRFDHDGKGSNPVWPNTIVDLEHVSPSGVTWAQLSAPSGATTGTTTTTPVTTPSPSSGAGQALTATGTSAVLTGAAGADTLNASQGFDTLTGGAGGDVFAFAKEPWAPIHITDFQPGQDKLDFRALFDAAGYTGTNPIGDGWMMVASDGNGGSIIRFDHDGPGPNPVWPNTIVDLEHVAPSQVTSSDWIVQ